MPQVISPVGLDESRFELVWSDIVLNWIIEFSLRNRLIVLLGVLALRTNRRIEWDATNQKANGVPEADAIIKESYRQGWEIA